MRDARRPQGLRIVAVAAGMGSLGKGRVESVSADDAMTLGHVAAFQVEGVGGREAQQRERAPPSDEGVE